MAFCASCGARITEGVKFCQGCGKAVSDKSNEPVAPTAQQFVDPKPQTAMEVKKKLNTMALAGFLLGLVSLLLNFFGIVGIVACVFSGLGLGKFNPETENNKWMAVLGILLGIFSIVYALIQMV